MLISGTPDDGDTKEKAADADLFGLRKVVDLRIEVTAEEYQAMQPPPRPPSEVTRRSRGRGARGSGRASGISSRSGSPGRGAVTAEGKTCKGVGLRYSGTASYMASAGGLKRTLPIDLGRSGHADFHGLRAMQLQGGALDPAKARGALAFAVFREAGVPAPRTALAEVTLTVPDRHDEAYLGLYTLAEPVDRAFLKDRFQTDKGLLLRPQGPRGLDFLGDDWEKYRGPYRPLSEPGPNASSSSSASSSRATVRRSARRSPRTSTSTGSFGSSPSRR